MLIQEVMTREVVAVHPKTPLKEVARLLVEHRIGGLPVVDDDDVVVGVISESDFTIKERGADYKRDSVLDRMTGRTAEDARRVAATTAGEAMSTPPVTIEGRTAFVREAAIMMLDRRVNRIPVVERGRLVGIISRGDLVRLYAQADEQIAERLRRSLHDVEVQGVVVEDVTDGIATLTGTVASAALAAEATEFAARVEGVIGVDGSHLNTRTASPNPGKTVGV
jgi:CBS domain-containing protein